MNTIQTIQELLTDLQEQQLQIETRAAEIAQAAEELSQTTAVQQAWRCGQQEERGRVVALIDLQLEQLGRSGINAISLQTLRRQLTDKP